MQTCTVTALPFPDVLTYVCLLQHEGKPYCNKPCYAALFGPKGKRIQLE